ncbi:hypothetical protein PPYR_02481 [Photinus pyralis]|uniref:Core Histone H2A/H2B/H3 domain-containing protein n=1 Tax=Photinus pyralis TaxID=7054 RepID=A0A1Y1KU82_PHOPY|nr:hypothetical protein PPYR_02481 [Photinus pyralis]
MKSKTSMRQSVSKSVSTRSTPASPKKKSKKRPTQLMLVGSKAFKVSVKILREIRNLQTDTSLLLPRTTFMRVIHEIIGNCTPEAIRVQKLALDALQEAAEAFVTQYFEDAYACCLHARRSTLIPRDMALVEFLRRPIGG